MEIRLRVSTTAARLIRAGQWRKAMDLAPLALWPRAVIKSVWQGSRQGGAG
jgi:hypothetical protein